MNEIELPEMYGAGALHRIVDALPPIERTYARIRFAILRVKLLSVMDLLLPEEGTLLDIGCGFGLFAAYFAQTHPRRHIIGVDPNAARIEMAKNVAARLGLDQLEFRADDARTVALEKSQQLAGAYILDVMHHIPRAEQEPLLERLRDALAPGGVLIIKDITTEPAFGLAFTAALDRLMVGFKEPLAYRHHREWAAVLTRMGFKVRMVRVPDFLPYPHVVIAARKTK